MDIISNHSDPGSASLSVVEFEKIPWEPKRIYWLANFSDGSSRGNHAHRRLSQVFIVISGRVEIEVFHGTERKTHIMTENGGALHLSPGAWRIISNATRDATLLVLADAPYDEEDYIRNWDEYLAWFNSEYINE